MKKTISRLPASELDIMLVLWNHEPPMGRHYALISVLCAAMFAAPASLLRRVCGGSCARRASGTARV